MAFFAAPLGPLYVHLAPHSQFENQKIIGFHSTHFFRFKIKFGQRTIRCSRKKKKEKPDNSIFFVECKRDLKIRQTEHVKVPGSKGCTLFKPRSTEKGHLINKLIIDLS